MINSKELAEKENSEVADKKSKLQGKSKELLYWMCISFFRPRKVTIYNLS